MSVTTRPAALLLQAAGETKYSARQTRTGQLSAASEPLLISGTTRKLRSNKKHQQQTTNSIVIVVEQSIPEQQLHERQTTSLMPVGYDRYHDSKHSISDNDLSIAGLFAPLSLALLVETISSFAYIIGGLVGRVTIPANANWAHNGVTVAGGNGSGSAANQINDPFGLFVDDDQTVVIAEWWNHRITQWQNGDTTNGQVVAGGNGAGNGLHRLNGPTGVLIDKETDSLIICDYGNRRVVRWSRRSGTTQGEILLDNIYCNGVAMDEQRYLYVSDVGKHQVRRYQLGEKNGTLVA
ncbi:unnamed protein product, partial [Rotaria magnacalcarata]